MTGLCEVCGERLPTAATGRPRRYCSDRCKKRASRKRKASGGSWRPATYTGPMPPPDATLVSRAASTDSQVVAAVHEAILLRNAFARLARDARPTLAARCEFMAQAIGDCLLEHFGAAIEE